MPRFKLTLCLGTMWPKLLMWMCHVSFNYLLTLKFVSMPCVIQLFIDPTFYECATCQHYECATCHQTMGQMFNLHNCNIVEMFNLHSCNLVEIVIIFLANAMFS
jgi:hypothetical protein